MLTLDYIKENTLWVIKFNCGRTVGTRKVVDFYRDDEDVREIDIVCWESQPKELQDFYKAMEESSIFFIDDFYKEWSKKNQ